MTARTSFRCLRRHGRRLAAARCISLPAAFSPPACPISRVTSTCSRNVATMTIPSRATRTMSTAIPPDATTTTTTSAAAATSTTDARVVAATARGSSTSSPIGIDLGTTQSCIAALQDGIPVVLHDRQGHMTTPSIVTMAADDDMLIGHAAKAAAGLNPRSTFAATKRLIARQYDDPLVESAQRQSSYEIVKAPNGEAWVKAPHGNLISPSQIAGYVLQKMKEIGEACLGEKIHDVVVTVPAYFNDNQRQATRNAGKIANLNIMRVVNEPTAAALAYGLGIKKEDDEKTIAVYDLGGGTFDISILHLDPEGVFEVLATNGDTFLGGEDIDVAVSSHFQKQFEALHGAAIDPEDKTAQTRLRQAAEKAKIELDHSDTAQVEIPFLANGKTLRSELSRDVFENLIKDVLGKTVQPCLQCMRDAKVKPQDIDQVLLVGGMTRSVAVHKRVEAIFQQKPDASVNPLEAVARGAAIQAGILTGAVRDVVLLDVTPLSLGLETLGGLMSVLIPRNTSVPTRQTQMFSTGVDNQTQVAIRVFQGERPLAEDNQFLGEFTLVDIPPAAKGTPKIEVTFDISADGIVQVSAKDAKSGHAQKIEVRSNGGLTQAEIEVLIKQAKLQQQTDAEKVRRAQIAAEVQAMIADVQSNVIKFQSQLSDSSVQRVNVKVDEMQNLLQDVNIGHEKLKQAALTFAKEAVELFRSAINK